MNPANYAPIYCALYPNLAEIARSHGYALAVHGSLARDFDLVCIPWRDDVDDPKAVLDEIAATFASVQIGGCDMKNHNRAVYTLSIGFGSCFIDLSFMPATAKDS